MSNKLKYQPNQKVSYKGYIGVIKLIINPKKKTYLVDFGNSVFQVQEEQLSEKQ